MIVVIDNDYGNNSYDGDDLQCCPKQKQLQQYASAADILCE